MNEIYFRQLLDSYITGQISGPDQVKLFDLLEQEDCRKVLEQLLREEWQTGNYEEQENPQVASLVEQYVLNKINEQKPAPVRSISFFRRYRITAAAVLVFAIAGTIWLASKDASKNNNAIADTKNQTQKIDIAPGTKGAVLTLDNGKQIILDSARDGLIAEQGNSSIIKKENGLSYESDATANTALYNTITTPKGKQYPNLILADGSKVWLDAGSSIRFPVAFTGKERKVEITGQVWFEVVHNDKMPFKVMAKGVEITDLGTAFNVNAYDDEEK